MDGVRDHQKRIREEVVAARRRLAAGPYAEKFVTPTDEPEVYRDALRARWKGGPDVLALLFVHPEAHAMRTLRSRVDYFDQRTGDLWDLFFPGFYLQTQDKSTYDDLTVGITGSTRWLFNPLGFDLIRRHVENASEGRWRYSGETDLVLIYAWLPEQGDPVLDWPSTFSRALTDGDVGVQTLTIGEVVERISRDFEQSLEDPTYGIDGTKQEHKQQWSGFSRDLLIETFSAIIAAVFTRASGLS